ncbi:ribokinase [Azospirillum lipoferum]|uniref:Ribokinase n=1 Tax=Azospirillum lipoferum (strain 4B) TaxID=862719 RepID=G7ZD77_AZOL4|nr:ribokinase [Azospirillum lipoferum]CBS89350.1 Ribokinase [Azospirillum lipoferum 4B]
MIVVFGSINLDMIFAMDDLPGAGQTLLARSLELHPGGKGANQAVAAAREGAAVTMAGAVGGDGLKETALSGLRSAGVELSRVAVTDRATGTAAVCTDAAGRNQIVVAGGANLQARAAQVEDALLSPGTTLLVQMESDPGETTALILRARRLGARVILNLAPAAPLPLPVLKAVDILVMNEDEAAWLGARLGCGGDAPSLHGVLGGTVIRTLGGDGVEWSSTDGSGHRPAPAVAVRDTTGAGDCFVGVLAAQLDRGQPLAAAIRRAAGAASLSCTRAGGQASLPTAAETDAALVRSVAGGLAVV